MFYVGTTTGSVGIDIVSFKLAQLLIFFGLLTINPISLFSLMRR